MHPQIQNFFQGGGIMCLLGGGGGRVRDLTLLFEFNKFFIGFWTPKSPPRMLGAACFITLGTRKKIFCAGVMVHLIIEENFSFQFILCIKKNSGCVKLNFVSYYSFKIYLLITLLYRIVYDRFVFISVDKRLHV